MYKKKPEGVFYDPDTRRLYEHRGYGRSIHWSQQMLDDLRRLYPTTLNDELAGILGVSPRTMIRKARELHLEKDPQWLANVWEKRRRWAHMSSRSKGYPGGFRKGEHANPDKEFKPGIKRSPEQRAKQSAGMREWYRTHPKAASAKALKAWETRRANQNRSVCSDAIAANSNNT